MSSATQTLIEKYKLAPHPEGGYYNEVYRSNQKVQSPANNAQRDAVTHIYFLLTKGNISAFHKVLHDEIWNFYEGAPLRLLKLDKKKCEEIIIGPGADSYCTTIPGGIFQAAETTGDYSLVGCTVAPGFDFEDFLFLAKNDPESHIITEQYKRFMMHSEIE